MMISLLNKNESMLMSSADLMIDEITTFLNFIVMKISKENENNYVEIIICFINIDSWFLFSHADCKLAVKKVVKVCAKLVSTIMF